MLGAVLFFIMRRRFPYEAQQYRSVIAAAVENYFTRALVGGENPCLEKSVIDRFSFVGGPAQWNPQCHGGTAFFIITAGDKGVIFYSV